MPPFRFPRPWWTTKADLISKVEAQAQIIEILSRGLWEALGDRTITIPDELPTGSKVNIDTQTVTTNAGDGYTRTERTMTASRINRPPGNT